ncbi:hypothetical protein WA026_013928 [Henosepilachna vigintioctopunctata]|uniref:Uncharacterized protein n=1 Tax=Henosepilachna vigintioctopunctata TaxID=420089 RepID=A0AAW1U6B0_9CUCU
MKPIFSFPLFCFLLASAQSYVLDEKFLEENADIVENLRYSEKRLKDRSTFIATVNDFSNKLLANFDKLVKKQKMDPLKMGELKESFLFGSLKLSDIHLNGMSTVYRSGQASIEYEKDSEQLTINIPIGLKNVEFGCDYKARVFLIGPSGKVTGGVTNIEVTTSIMIDFNAYRAIVRNFEIVKSGHISVNFHGNPLTDWVVNIMMNATTMMFKGIILTALDLVIGGSMSKAVEEIDDLLAFLR